MALWGKMTMDRIKMYTITYNAAVSAGEKGREWGCDCFNRLTHTFLRCCLWCLTKSGVSATRRAVH